MTNRRLLATWVCHVPLLLGGALLAGGCSVPHVMGLGAYYAVTDPASGRVWYTDQLQREDRGVIEFRDAATGAWISLPAGEAREITAAEFRAGQAR